MVFLLRGIFLHQAQLLLYICLCSMMCYLQNTRAFSFTVLCFINQRFFEKTFVTVLNIRFVFKLEYKKEIILTNNTINITLLQYPIKILFAFVGQYFKNTPIFYIQIDVKSLRSKF